jgi:hypothetical protein
MVTKNIYDNEVAVNDYVKDLKTLHEIIDVRCVAHYTHGVMLNEFKILDGYLLMDTCGNTMIQVSGDSNSYYVGRLPKETDKCPHCGEGWTMHNIKNHVSSWDYNVPVFHHKDCRRMKLHEEQREEFIKIFSQVYENCDLSFKPIPNCYDRDYIGYAPWFIISTPDGSIKIGWRKRVINISWLDDYVIFNDNFEDQDVTKCFKGGERYIHAWCIEHCVEYLKRAKDSKLEL